MKDGSPTRTFVAVAPPKWAVIRIAPSIAVRGISGNFSVESRMGVLLPGSNGAWLVRRCHSSVTQVRAGRTEI